MFNLLQRSEFAGDGTLQTQSAFSHPEHALALPHPYTFPCSPGPQIKEANTSVNQYVVRASANGAHVAAVSPALRTPDRDFLLT